MGAGSYTAPSDAEVITCMKGQGNSYAVVTLCLALFGGLLCYMVGSWRFMLVVLLPMVAFIIAAINSHLIANNPKRRRQYIIGKYGFI